MPYTQTKVAVTNTWTEIVLSGATKLTLQNTSNAPVLVAISATQPAADSQVGNLLSASHLQTLTLEGLSSEKIWVRSIRATMNASLIVLKI